MKLYHTGNAEIRVPDVRRGRKNADFGQGFYLTPDLEFARRWAGADATLNEYELDTGGLQVHTFRRDEEWFRYVFRNRRAEDALKADVVVGPIANDTIFETFGIVTSGYLEAADAMRLLMIGPEYIQVAVKTKKAAKQLRWLGAARIEGQDAAARASEQEAYSAAFAAVLGKIVEEE